MTKARATRVRLLGVSVAAGVAVVFACLSVRATAAPAPFLLTFDGVHVADTTLGFVLRHDGRFTASAPFCSAGQAHDVRQSTDEGGMLNVLRIHTCDDGSGSFTADMPTVRSEHGGSGSWRIVEGTGRYATLRGLGTYTGTLISGDPNVFETISYKTNWQGLVAFDADPPTIETLTTTPRKLRQRVRTYTVRVGLAVSDPSAPVSYTVDVRSGRVPLAFKQGSTASGQATITLRIRPPRAARSASVSLTARDALGNETSASQMVTLR